MNSPLLNLSQVPAQSCTVFSHSLMKRCSLSLWAGWYANCQVHSWFATEMQQVGLFTPSGLSEIRSREPLMTPCFMTGDKPLKIRLPAYSLQAAFVTLEMGPHPVRVPVLLPATATFGNLRCCELPGPIWLQYLHGQAYKWPVEDVATHMDQDGRKNWSDLIETPDGTRLLCMCCTLIFCLSLRSHCLACTDLQVVLAVQGTSGTSFKLSVLQLDQVGRSPDSALRQIQWRVQVLRANIEAQPMVLCPAFYIELQYELDYDRNSSHKH